jgi:two-component system invasion response regulator UvrY
MNQGQNSSKKRRFLIVEDHPLYRQAVGLLIENWFPHSETVGVESVEKARAALQKHRFDLVILDIELGDRSGFELLQDCKSLGHPVKILMVSGHTRSDYVTRALKLGATGYISKLVSNDELEEALHAVLSNRLYLSKDVARTVAEATLRNHHLPAHAVLRVREFEVLLLLARGMRPKEIATALNLSVRTVAVHKFKSFKKIGIRNMVDLFRYCQEHRLLNYDHISGMAA